MTDNYKTLGDKPFESAYLMAEATIDHPVEKVWPHALDIGSWMSDHRLETIAGSKGQVGHLERVYPEGLGEESGQPHYHVYGIAKIIPQKFIGLEVLPEMGGSYGIKREWMSFDGILLVDLGGRTRVIFHLIDVHLGKAVEKNYIQEAIDKDGPDRIRRYFEKLKALVDNAS